MAMGHFSKGQEKNLLIVYVSVSLVTVVVCIIGLTFVFVLKLYRKIVYRLASYQALGACFFGLARVLQLVPKRIDNPSWDSGEFSLCKFVAYAEVFTFWVKLILIVSVTVHLFVFTVFLKNLKKLDEFVYVTSAVIIGLAVAAIPFQFYGDVGPWCWISKPGTLYEIVIWYVPALTVLVATALMVIVIVVVSVYRICKYKTQGIHCAAAEQQSLTAQDNRSLQFKQALYLQLPLLVYPIGFCIVVIFPLVSGVAVHADLSLRKQYGLWMASAVAIPAMGLVAGLAFVVHIVCMRITSLKMASGKSPSNVKDCHYDFYTINLSTACNTHFVAARESDIETQESSLYSLV